MLQSESWDSAEEVYGRQQEAFAGLDATHDSDAMWKFTTDIVCAATELLAPKLRRRVDGWDNDALCQAQRDFARHSALGSTLDGRLADDREQLVFCL